MKKPHSTTVNQPVDPTVTDLSYDPNSIVKTIKQQPKHLNSEETEQIVTRYQQGESTYDCQD